MHDLSFTSPKTNGNFSVKYRTTTGKIYPIEIGYGTVLSSLVPVDSKATTKACKNGCGLYGRNGGCPPFSPIYSNICRKNLLIIYGKLSTKNYPTKILKGPYYPRWAFVETFLTSLTNKIGQRVALAFNGKFLSSGQCKVCKPKRCAVKDGDNCRTPNLRTFSLEATGILVSELLKQSFFFELQWWKAKEPNFIPEYMVKVVGVTVENEFNLYEIKNRLELDLRDNERIII